MKFLILSLAVAMLDENAQAYVGRNNGRDCFVKVDFYDQDKIYALTVSQQTKSGATQSMSFVITQESRVNDRSYVERTTDFIETSVDVETGRLVKFFETYGSDGAEGTMGLEIHKNNEVKSAQA